MEPRTVVTMTSWKGRIKYLAKQIFVFMNTQSVKPDLFYLWLAEEEFPKREESLPNDLLLTCEAFDVKICWTKKNEFCFKRWHVYPEHYHDLVISIDDDILFDSDLIKEAKKHINERNISYNIFKDLTFRYRFTGGDTRQYDYKEPSSIYYRFLGCSVICPETFPLMALDPKYLEIRERVNRRQDEQWIKAFMIMNMTKISFMDFNYNKSSIGSISDKNATWKCFYKKYEGHRVEDYQLYFTLISVPNLLQFWKKAFPNYNNQFFEKIGIKRVKEILKTNGC